MNDETRPTIQCVRFDFESLLGSFIHIDFEVFVARHTDTSKLEES